MCGDEAYVYTCVGSSIYSITGSVVGCALLSVSTLGSDIAFFVRGRLFFGKGGGTVWCSNFAVSTKVLV